MLKDFEDNYNENLLDYQDENKFLNNLEINFKVMIYRQILKKSLKLLGAIPTTSFNVKRLLENVNSICLHANGNVKKYSSKLLAAYNIIRKC
ncbi:hypothetical protein DOY81_001430 [Sarcophaga bullata]|nr:hypothetical protein DOY81_001430 [Sarcophaga bullata]